MPRLKALIGSKVLAIIPSFGGPTKIQEITLHGVEFGGLWVESQDLTNSMLTALGQQAAPNTLIFFLPWNQITCVMSPIDSPTLNEKSFGV